MNTIVHQNLSVQVVRTKRIKTASIQIRDGLVKAVVPDQISDFKVETLIKKRMPWIRKKLQDESKIISPSKKEYVSGECLTYLGKNYRLKVIANSKCSVKLVSGYIVVSTSKKSPNKIKELLTQWYIDHAMERLKEKTDRYSNIIGVSPNTVSVRDYKSKWGSCSSDGKISYNWRIIMSPHRVVDYIVIHELCHMLEHNHSKEFWRHVSNNCKDYRECRDWLKINGKSLVI